MSFIFFNIIVMNILNLLLSLHSYMFLTLDCCISVNVGGSETIVTIYGHAADLNEFLNKIAPHIRTAGYVNKKRYIFLLQLYSVIEFNQINILLCLTVIGYYILLLSYLLPLKSYLCTSTRID